MDKPRDIKIEDQYKFAAESIDRARERRQKENRFFMVLLTGLGTLFGAAQKFLVTEAHNFNSLEYLPLALLALVLWCVICVLWQLDLILYSRSNMSWFRILKEIEGSNNFPLFILNKKYLDEYLEEGSENQVVKKYCVSHRFISITRRSLPSALLTIGIVAFFMKYLPFDCSVVLYPIAGLILYRLCRFFIKSAGG